MAKNIKLKRKIALGYEEFRPELNAIQLKKDDTTELSTLAQNILKKENPTGSTKLFFVGPSGLTYQTNAEVINKISAAPLSHAHKISQIGKAGEWTASTGTAIASQTPILAGTECFLSDEFAYSWNSNIFRCIGFEEFASDALDTKAPLVNSKIPSEYLPDNIIGGMKFSNAVSGVLDAGLGYNQLDMQNLFPIGLNDYDFWNQGGTDIDEYIGYYWILNNTAFPFSSAGTNPVKVYDASGITTIGTEAFPSIKVDIGNWLVFLGVDLNGETASAATYYFAHVDNTYDGATTANAGTVTITDRELNGTTRRHNLSSSTDNTTIVDEAFLRDILTEIHFKQAVNFEVADQINDFTVGSPNVTVSGVSPTSASFGSIGDFILATNNAAIPGIHKLTAISVDEGYTWTLVGIFTKIWTTVGSQAGSVYMFTNRYVPQNFKTYTANLTGTQSGLTVLQEIEDDLIFEYTGVSVL